MREIKKTAWGLPLGPLPPLFVIFSKSVKKYVFFHQFSYTTPCGAWGGLQTVQEAQKKHPRSPKIHKHQVKIDQKSMSVFGFVV